MTNEGDRRLPDDEIFSIRGAHPPHKEIDPTEAIHATEIAEEEATSIANLKNLRSIHIPAIMRPYEVAFTEAALKRFTLDDKKRKKLLRNTYTSVWSEATDQGEEKFGLVFSTDKNGWVAPEYFRYKNAAQASTISLSFDRGPITGVEAHIPKADDRNPAVPEFVRRLPRTVIYNPRPLTMTFELGDDPSLTIRFWQFFHNPSGDDDFPYDRYAVCRVRYEYDPAKQTFAGSASVPHRRFLRPLPYLMPHNKYPFSTSISEDVYLDGLRSVLGLIPKDPVMPV